MGVQADADAAKLQQALDRAQAKLDDEYTKSAQLVHDFGAKEKEVRSVARHRRGSRQLKPARRA